MATKKRESKSLSSMAFAAIMGQGSAAETEAQQAPAKVEAPKAKPAEKPAPKVEPKPEPKPVPAAAPVMAEPAQVMEAAPVVYQRRPGRPASKSPKRNYGVSLCIEDYEALKEMAKGSDKTITELLTMMIAEYDRNHPELREKYRKIMDLLNS